MSRECGPERGHRPSRPRPVGGSRLAIACCLALLAAACGGDDPVATHLGEPTDRVTLLEVVGGAGQRILAGRRSPEPVRVRATDADGRPVEGAFVTFSLEGETRSVLSQPTALTDDAGVAETFLLDPRSGSGVLTAVSGQGRTTVEVVVERAPGELRFAPGTGQVGLPGHPHPDSIVRVRVLDTEGRPMDQVEVWFAGPRVLAPHRDTTDAEGWAGTVIRQAELRAGDGLVYAFLLDFPELTVSTSRPLEPAARKIVLVSIDGLRGDALERYRPPTLARLAREGASTGRARTVVPSLTTPAHLSLFSGVAPATHENFSEELTFNARMAELDPLFRHAGREGLKAEAFMASDSPLADFEVALDCKLAFGFESLTVVDPPWSRIAEAAARAFTDPEIRMVFVHIPDPDVAGHAHGFESEEYGEAVLRADSSVARIVESLGDEALLIVTSDHGGGGAYGPYQHGSDSPEDLRIPLLIWGPRVAPAELGEESILDVAPTALWALGFGVPSQYEGTILLGAFR